MLVSFRMSIVLHFSITLDKQVINVYYAGSFTTALSDGFLLLGNIPFINFIRIYQDMRM